MISFRTLCIFFVVVNFTYGEIRNKGWWRNAVFYQIYPRSFMDANNDGVGDLTGITQKLEHFVESGIDAIWMSPIYASPMVDFGYDIADFRDIDPTFGTMKDFENLIARAKALGIKVILDLVPNHTSDKHEWFQKSLAGIGKYRDYYVWKNGRKNDTKTPPNNWLSLFTGSAWEYVESRKQWYLHQYERRQPDLNYYNPEVRDEMEDVIRFWLRKGVDGFRVDAVLHLFEDPNFPDEPRSYLPEYGERDYKYLKHIYSQDNPCTYDLIRSWRKVLDDYADVNNEEEKVMMTEAYTSLENTTRYYQYGSHIPFNFRFIVDVNASSSARDFKNIIDSWLQKTPNGSTPNWVMGNHDNSRTATRYAGRADQMTMLAMILPGVAVTYNGEEIGMEDKKDITWEETQDPQACNAGKDEFRRETRDPNRTPYQWDSSLNAGFSKANRTWLPVNANYKQLNLRNQKTANESHYKIYKALVNLRKTHPSYVPSNWRLLNNKIVTLNNNTVLVVIRGVNVYSLTLLINFLDDKSQVVNLSNYLPPGLTIVEVASLNSGIKPGTSVDSSKINLPAKAALVISHVSSVRP